MLKKILPLLFLAALVAWGVYDYIQGDAGAEGGGTSDPSEEQAETGIEQGDQAPDFTLQSLQGEQMKLSDLRGKNVMINFWATWCPPCRVEMPHMQEYYETHKENDFAILAVNLTSTEKSENDIEPFVNEMGLTFPVVLDTDNKVTDTYEVTGYPTSYFVDKQGVIRHKVVGAMNQDMIAKLIEGMN